MFRLTKGVHAIVHTAALHAPHVPLFNEGRFWQVNVKATENLLDASLHRGVKRFVFTSTTSVYGDALVKPDQAVWVTEELQPQPRDTYDRTKLAAEALCKEASELGLSCITLRMSRCFPEDPRLMAIYRLYRGVDIRDVALGHMLALHSPLKGYEVFNISANSPFQPDDLANLAGKASQIITHYYPWALPFFEQRGWQRPSHIDRVYVTQKAQKVLGFHPRYGFDRFCQQLGKACLKTLHTSAVFIQ